MGRALFCSSDAATDVFDGSLITAYNEAEKQPDIIGRTR